MYPLNNDFKEVLAVGQNLFLCLIAVKNALWHIKPVFNSEKCTGKFYG
jgi:hypothetical protein